MAMLSTYMKVHEWLNSPPKRGEQTAVMNYVSKFLSNFKEFYNEINSATLTGAIDVVIVRLEDGSYACSPFHVRFGKIGVLRSREKVVDIEINDKPVNIHMKLGETGEAFFVEETEDIDEVPSHLATSPIPTYDLEKELNKRMASENSVRDGLDVRLKSNWSDNDSENICTDMEMMKRNEHRNGRSGGSASEPRSPGSSKFSSNQGRMSVSEGTLYSERDRHELEGVTRLYERKKSSQGAHSHYSSEGILAENKNLTYMPQISPSDQSGVADEDKSKKKKRRKRSTVKKRKEQQVESSDDDEMFQLEMEVNDDEGNVSQSNSSSTTSVQTRKVSSFLDHQNQITASSVQTSVNQAGLPSTSRAVPHSWPYKSSMQLNLEIHPFSDGDVTPILSPVTSRPPTPKSDTEYEISKQETASQTDCGDNPWSWKWGELPVPPKTDKHLHDSTISDDEMHAKRLEQESDDHRSMLGGMFRFMRKTKKIRHQPESEGIYLDELNPDEMDPEVAKLYFPQRNSSLHLQNAADVKCSAIQIKDEDVESGNGSSLPQSPYSVEGGLGSLQGIDSDNEERHPIFDFKGYNDLAISLCGGLAAHDGAIPQERFMHSLVTYDDFCEHPEMLHNPDLVIRLNNKYYNWETVAPMVLSLILYQRPLSDRTVNVLVRECMPKKPKKSETKGYSWFSWRRSAQSDDDRKKSDNDGKKSDEDRKQSDEDRKKSDNDRKKTEKKSDEKKKTDVEEGLKAETTEDESELKMVKVEDPPIPSTGLSIPNTPPKEKPISKLSNEMQQPMIRETASITIPIRSETDSSNPIEIKSKSEKRLSKGTEGFKKTLRLSSEQIKHLNLHPGRNEVVFSVTTAYQGTTRCKCHIYLWNFDDKIVISDIDGTITKSDVLGHILPIIGKDWAQSGVAQLFTKIKNNGYQFLYLSARAIGQARVTREYLKSVRQGDVCLPDGPLLLNPSSLISAFHREVIEKKPEDFKISCLKDIQALFPSAINPFYAGYGNRINDVWAYRAVGIPISRIFTINHKGELKHELTQTFQSTYSGLSYVVDHLFPPLRRSSLSDGVLTSNFEGSEEYSAFTYWRAPIPEIQIDIPETKAIEKKSEEKKSKPLSGSV
uniref:phosphatidate phosphatase n=1 Tax=Strigamia maritima TaxID=126957 RepID=T1JA68_STRMM